MGIEFLSAVLLIMIFVGVGGMDLNVPWPNVGIGVGGMDLNVP
jgi:hypothetical protein